MILVSDTSVLIDLDRGGLLEAVFELPDEFAVPDVLYDREMQGEWGEQLRQLGLRVEEVSETGVANALRYRQQRTSLSGFSSSETTCTLVIPGSSQRS